MSEINMENKTPYAQNNTVQAYTPVLSSDLSDMYKQEMDFASVFADSSRNYIYFDLVTWAGQITLQISNHLIYKRRPK